MNDALLRLALIAIAAITVISGASQIVAPDFVLRTIGAVSTEASRHLFATVGMFMVVTGAMFLQALVTRSTERAIPLWIGVQKIAAAVLVGWGYQKELFGALALGVAGFDLVSGALAWWYLARRAQ